MNRDRHAAVRHHPGGADSRRRSRGARGGRARRSITSSSVSGGDGPARAFPEVCHQRRPRACSNPSQPLPRRGAPGTVRDCCDRFRGVMCCYGYDGASALRSGHRSVFTKIFRVPMSGYAPERNVIAECPRGADVGSLKAKMRRFPEFDPRHAARLQIVIAH